MRRLRVWIAAMVFAAVPVGGQMGVPPPPPQFPGSPSSGRPSLDAKPFPGVEERQALARNNDRQRRLVDDTNKLLQLATELKTQVDKTNANMLSVEMIKKADEIEKLAHSVKDRMKG